MFKLFKTIKLFNYKKFGVLACNLYNKTMLDIKEEKNGISIKIIVTPNSSQSLVIGVMDGMLKIKLNSPPIEGKANKEIINSLSKLINIPKTSIEILRGEKNKVKTLLIKGDIGTLQNKIKNLHF